MSEAGLEEMKAAVLAFDGEKAKATARRLIEQGADPVQCAEALADSLRIIGDRYSAGEAFIPELFAAAKVAKGALGLITDEIKKQGKKVKSLGKVVIGTVFGDIHSIGKDIVATLLFTEGFEVIDLGVNVKARRFPQGRGRSQAGHPGAFCALDHHRDGAKKRHRRAQDGRRPRQGQGTDRWKPYQPGVRRQNRSGRLWRNRPEWSQGCPTAHRQVRRKVYA